MVMCHVLRGLQEPRGLTAVFSVPHMRRPCWKGHRIPWDCVLGSLWKLWVMCGEVLVVWVSRMVKHRQFSLILAAPGSTRAQGWP